MLEQFTATLLSLPQIKSLTLLIGRDREIERVMQAVRKTTHLS